MAINKKLHEVIRTHWNDPKLKDVLAILQVSKKNQRNNFFSTHDINVILEAIKIYGFDIRRIAWHLKNKSYMELKDFFRRFKIGNFFLCDIKMSYHTALF